MSHAKERTQKDCLNCNAEVLGRYCQVCGQENIETHETFWQLTTHLIYDIVHFDGKFFSTLRSLLFRPGFLTKEYIRGRRASYLHPIRMYVFTSTVFFIIFFSFIVPLDDIHTGKNDEAVLSATHAGNDKQKKKADSILREAGIPARITRDSTTGERGKDTLVMNGTNFKITGDTLPPTIAAYDSIQKTLPEAKRDGWVKRAIKRRSIEVKGKYKGDNSAFIKDIFVNFLHSLPKMMFISLPLAALLLQLLYVRRRKQFLYVQHGVFLIHVYIAIYIFIMIQYGLQALNELLDWSIISYVIGFIVLLIFFYVYKAMRNFYGQGRGKTILKFLLFNLLYLITLVLLAGIFFATSIFEL